MGSRITVAAAALMLAMLGNIAVGLTGPSAEPNGSVSIRGCVIRFDELTPTGATKPRIHANETHRCVGVTRVHADRESGDLFIRSDSHAPIMSISVSPDETLAQRGITCGASGGIGLTRIRCFDRDGNQVAAHSAAIFGPRANLWVGWTSWTG